MARARSIAALFSGGWALAGNTSAEATPAAGGRAFLFVQGCESGTFVPRDQHTFTITLQHGLGETIYFADRPEREAGFVSTADFLAAATFDPADPPNAAMVVRAGDDTEAVAILELTDPVYDRAMGTLSYTAKPVAGDPGNGTPSVGEIEPLPPTFGPGALFIDSLKFTDDTAAQVNRQLRPFNYQGSNTMATDDAQGGTPTPNPGNRTPRPAFPECAWPYPTY